jgi:hypothetical protein
LGVGKWKIFLRSNEPANKCFIGLAQHKHLF